MPAPGRVEHASEQVSEQQHLVLLPKDLPQTAAVLAEMIPAAFLRDWTPAQGPMEDPPAGLERLLRLRDGEKRWHGTDPVAVAKVLPDEVLRVRVGGLSDIAVADPGVEVPVGVDEVFPGPVTLPGHGQVAEPMRGRPMRGDEVPGAPVSAGHTIPADPASGGASHPTASSRATWTALTAWRCLPG